MPSLQIVKSAWTVRIANSATPAFSPYIRLRGTATFYLRATLINRLITRQSNGKYFKQTNFFNKIFFANKFVCLKRIVLLCISKSKNNNGK